MKAAAALIALAVLAPARPAVAQEPAPRATPNPATQQTKCREANAYAVQVLREAPAPTPKDKADKEMLQRRIEGMIAENRRKGVSECTIWAEVNKIAVGQ